MKCTKRLFIGGAISSKSQNVRKGCFLSVSCPVYIKVISDATAMESVALKAAMVLPALVLQRPHPRSSAKDHTRCLEDGLSRWLKGSINSLLHKCRSIQGSLHYQQQQSHDAGKRARSCVSGKC